MNHDPSPRRGLSLGLRLNLMTLLFAGVVAAVPTGLGAWLLHLQQRDAALARAELAAAEMATRAHRLLELGLPLQDVLGLDELCATVRSHDPLLRWVALMTPERQTLAQAGAAPAGWQAPPLPLQPADRLHYGHALGEVAMQAVRLDDGAVQAWTAVQVDAAAVQQATLLRLAWLVGSAALLFSVALLLQQWLFWRQIGRPLQALVDAADRIHPDDPRPDATPLAPHTPVEIARVHAALARLAVRLSGVHDALLAQNRRLEATVRERTRALEQANQALRAQADTDGLTGLASRGFILAHARDRLARLAREGGSATVLMIDLDGFKAVNDRHGHAAGDEVLRAVGQRLRPLCRAQDVLARLGGDEFLLWLEPAPEPAALQALAERLLAALAAPGLPVDLGPQPLGASLGVARCPQDGDRLEALLATADAAMYAAKRAGGGLRTA
jgi:diguanylate cyclase (GGDEF)-like protein